MPELHTSDLTAACARTVQLRHEGKVVGEYTGALYCGSLFGESVAILHRSGSWKPSPDAVRKMVQAADARVRDQAKIENRPLSDSVVRNYTDTFAEVAEAVRLYAQRFAGLFGLSRFIGCEVPIRWTFMVDDEPVEFASHLDLLFRDPNGILTVWDWKWREDAPTLAYLGRNLQFNSYALAVRYGEVMLPGETYAHDDWVSMDEWPSLAWMHAPGLFPYAKATTGKDDSGQQASFKKGDLRPMRCVLMHNDFNPEREGVVMDELALRVRMSRAGMFPTNPDPIGCHLCESSKWCPSTLNGEVP